MIISAELAKRFSTEYSDEYNRNTKLTNNELEFFKAAVQRVIAATGINIPVYTHNHEILPGSSGDALGIHWVSVENSDDEFITIDCYFIHEAYEVAYKGRYDLTGETLETVICHELAHMRYQRHTKYHAALTAKYIKMVNAA